MRGPLSALGGCVLLLLLLLLLVTVGTASASEPSPSTPPVSASPTTVTVEANGNGSVALSNNLAVDLHVTFNIVDAAGATVAGSTASSLEGGSLKAGATAPLTLHLPSSVPKATLVVVTEPTSGLPAGAVLRLPLSNTPAVEAAVKKWTFVDEVLGGDRGAGLPLTGPCSGLGIEGSAPLGSVQAGGESLSVRGSCDQPSSESLTLTQSGGGSTGREYSGSIKVAGGEVELTVSNTLSWWIAAALILLGIVVALGVTAWQGWGRSSGELLQKTYLIEQLVSNRNPASVDAGFKEAASKLGLPENVREWTVAAAVRAQLGELRGPLRRFPKEEELKKTGEALDALELALREWRKVPETLANLKAQLPRIETLHAYVEAVEEKTLKRSGPLAIADMEEVRSKADEALKLAAEWPAEGIQSAKTMAEGLPDADQAVVDFNALMARLYETPNAEQAGDAIDVFWEVDEKLREAVAAKAPAFAPMVETPEAGGGPPSSPPPAAVETVDPASTARGIGAAIRTIDAVILVVLLLAALVAGMQALWVGKSFGGFWGVVAALVWGLGAGALGAPVSAAIADAGRAFTRKQESV